MPTIAHEVAKLERHCEDLKEQIDILTDRREGVNSNAFILMNLRDLWQKVGEALSEAGFLRKLQPFEQGHDDNEVLQALGAALEKAKAGAAVEVMGKMMQVPDLEYPLNSVDYVQIGVDESGRWSVQRWYDAEAADAGPLGEGETPLDALSRANERLRAKAEEQQ